MLNPLTHKRKLSVARALQHFDQVLAEVEGGTAMYALTRNGKAVARLIPPDSKEARDFARLDTELRKMFKEYGSVLRELAEK